MTDNAIDRYRMSTEEHGKVLEKLKGELFSRKNTQGKSEAVFVVGQPGCGKSTFIETSDFSQCVIINSDDYRRHHSSSSEILRDYPTQYVTFTNHDAHLLGDELFKYGIDNGYSVLREKAPKDATLLAFMSTLLERGYSVTVYVVVCGNLESLLRTRERYERELREGKPAKLSNIGAHNTIYDFLPSFISECLSLGVSVNLIIPIEKKYINFEVGNDFLPILEQCRCTSNRNAISTYHDRIKEIICSMKKRGAPQEQYDELDKIEKVYSELVSTMGETKPVVR